MKNFRKVLALILVVAVLFSFAAMASAKSTADYTDGEDVNYTEAVDVLSAIGILDGYTDGSFQPTKNIEREEMAKMIAVLANAGSDVKDLYASACTFADAKNSWAASYIAYCAQTGIIAGRSATTFDPDANVTGIETAKMLLVVLGFDAEAQGYVGANWKVNVLRDAETMGLLENFADGYDANAAITREEAAQMMLNALEAPCVVGVLSGNLINVTNALVYDKATLDGYDAAKYVKVNSYATLLDSVKAGKWCLYGNAVISDDTLAWTLFGLVKNTAATSDCYKRPVTYWTWTDAKGNEKTITSTTLKPVWTSYNTTVGAVNQVTGAYAEGKYTVTYYKNGESAAINAGKGSLVEIYVIGREVRVVEIETFIDRITEVDTYDKTVTIGTTNPVTGTNTFGLKTTDVGKVALYWVCSEGLHNVELVTPTALTVTKAVKSNTTGESYFQAGADKYEYADTFNSTINLDLKIFGEDNGYGVGEEWNVYFDKYGFVMGYTQDNSIDYKYGVVDFGSARKYSEGFHKENGVDVEDFSYTVKMVNFEENPAVGDAIAADENMYARVDNSKFSSDTLVRYYVDAAGRVCVDGDVNVNRAYKANVTLADTVMAVDGAYLTRDTQILLRVENPMTGKTEYKYFDGIDELDATYLVENLGYYYEGKYMTYAYGEAEYTLTGDTAYMLGKGSSIVYLTDGSTVVGYNTYRALVNGEEVIIATKDVVSSFNKVYKLNCVCIGLKTDDGAPVYFASEIDDYYAATEVTTIDTDKGLMFYGTNTWKLDDNAKFILVFTDGWGDDEYSEPMTAAELVEYTRNWDHVYVWVDDTDGNGAVDLVYVNAQDGD